MFHVEYLYKLLQVNRNNGARRRTMLRPGDSMVKPSKDIKTVIHPHYNEMFQRLVCFLSEDI